MHEVTPIWGRTPELSVVVPATDRPQTLERCRAAILDADDPPEELIIVEEPPGAGPAEARNTGAALATGSVLVFVDSDVVVRPDTFTRFRAAFEADPELAALFGSYDDSPSPHGVVSTFRNLLHHHMHQRSAGPASTFWAGLGAIRSNAFRVAGGFDAERFSVPSVEDVELGLRLHADGAAIKLDPNIQGTHLKEWPLGSMVTTDFLHRGVPWMGLLLEHGPGAARLNASTSHRLSAASCASGLGAAAVGRRGLAALLTAGFLRFNLSFYALLLRRAGPRAALAGLGLHILHTLTALASAPAGAVVFSFGRARRPLADADRASAASVPSGYGSRARRFVRGARGPSSAAGTGTPAPDSSSSRVGVVV